FGGALEAYRRALEVFEALPDQKSMQGFVHAQLGAQLSALEQWEAAEAEYQQALEIAEEIDAAGENAADALQGLSAVAKRRGHLARALLLDRRVLEILEALGDPVKTAIARNNLALSLVGTDRKSTR